MSTKMAHTHLLISAALLCAPAIARADQLVGTGSLRFPNVPAGRCTFRFSHTGASQTTELSEQLPEVRSCTGISVRTAGVGRARQVIRRANAV